MMQAGDLVETLSTHALRADCIKQPHPVQLRALCLELENAEGKLATHP